MLKNCFGEGDLELYEGSLELKVDDWRSLPAISLREAVILANPKNDFGCCNCKTGCKKDLCSCRKRYVCCTSKCHGGNTCHNQQADEVLLT